MAAAVNKKWKEGLDILQCPYTEGLSTEEVNDLLLNESEERLDILEWLLMLYKPQLIEILDPASRRTGKNVKFRIERILKAVEYSCMCVAEDVHLIKGMAPPNKQKLFLNRLIELALSRESEQISPREDGAYLDRLGSQGVCLAIEDKVGLIPKDLRAEVHCSYPGLDDLKASQLECAVHVEKLQREIAELQKKADLKTPINQKEVVAMNGMLSSSIQDLDQVASGFLHSYESHIGAWCQGSQPDLNDVGPAAKRVHKQLNKFLPLMEDIDKLRQLQCDLEDNIKEKHTRKLVEAVSMGDNTSDYIQRCLGIVEESMHRIESGFSSRYPSSLQL